MQNINCWNIYGGFMSRLFLKQVLFHSYSSYPASADDPLSICFVSIWRRANEGLTLETSAFLLFTVANLRFQPSC